MERIYSEEKNIQILLALLKCNGIKRMVVSPGGTNLTFVASVQNDPDFEIYSSIDERSAAYMACGMAAESGEPVVLSCTGATASRNYMPALTEAYYRKLPILVVTSSRSELKIGHLQPQITDRSQLPADVVFEHVQLPEVVDSKSEHQCRIRASKAILALSHKGGGPAHIDLLTTGSSEFTHNNLPHVTPIKRVIDKKSVPALPDGTVAVFIGAHKPFSIKETRAIESFCEVANAVVLVDHTSNYKGAYALNASLLLAQPGFQEEIRYLRLLIHMGEISGDYYSMRIGAEEVWRLNEDGEIRDLFGALTTVLEMSPLDFFSSFTGAEKKGVSLYERSQAQYQALLNKIPELPFSNLWIAKRMSNEIPENSVIHFGILNSLRCWNFFTLPQSVRSNCNVGGFGIDGIMSTLIGASLINPDTLYFSVLGDLAFFYDLNSLGNRHIQKNVRILLVNNGIGQEFKNPIYENSYHLGDEIDSNIAAKGHFGNQSPLLVRHYAEDLGFKYISASSKDEFEEVYREFLTDKLEQPIIFEVFTKSEEESRALDTILNLIPRKMDTKKKIKSAIKSMISQEKIEAIKTLLS